MPPPGDVNVYQQLGRLTAQVEALQAAIVLSRNEVKEQLQHLDDRVENLHEKMIPLEYQQDAITEAQESMRKKVAALTSVSAKTTWIMGTITTIGGGIFLGLVWIFLHWTELWTVLGKIFSPQGQGKG